jgi:hypothetical protein
VDIEILNVGTGIRVLAFSSPCSRSLKQDPRFVRAQNALNCVLFDLHISPVDQEFMGFQPDSCGGHRSMGASGKGKNAYSS